MPALNMQTLRGLVAKATAALHWLLVIGIAYTLATTVLFFLRDPAIAKANASPTPAPAASEAPQKTVPVDLQAISAAKLFGDAKAKVAKPPVEETTVETRLPLKLLGVFVADAEAGSGAVSAAVIAESNQPGKLYRVGDRLPGAATLDTVHADHVTLLRSGARELLRFTKLKPFRTMKILDKGAPRTVAEMPQLRQTAPAKAAPTKTKAAPKPVRDFVAAYRERLQEAPEQVLEELEVEAVNGGGYRVGDLGDLPYLSQSGLQPGDLILSVNGRPMGDINADQLALDDLLAAGEVRIEVQRGERRFFLTTSIGL